MHKPTAAAVDRRRRQVSLAPNLDGLPDLQPGHLALFGRSRLPQH